MENGSKRYYLYIYILEREWADTTKILLITWSTMNVTNAVDWKKQHVELYKLNLPANVVNDIVEYHYDRDDECKKCQRWRYHQHQIDCCLNIKRVFKRDVEDDVIIFLQVYERNLPPIEYVRKFMRISERRYDIFDR